MRNYQITRQRKHAIIFWYEASCGTCHFEGHIPGLQRLGVVSLSLFGSTARDEATDHSDVDVAVRLKDLGSGLAEIGRLELIKHRLSEILGSRVDVVPEPTEHGRLPARIDEDRCVAF
jgi:predicted nucleotidyltransferase